MTDKLLGLYDYTTGTFTYHGSQYDPILKVKYIAKLTDEEAEELALSEEKEKKYSNEVKVFYNDGIVGQDINETLLTASYVVIVNAAENGTISADVTTAAANSTVTLSVAPDIGYAVADVTYTVNGETTTVQPVEGVYRFTMPEGDVTVSATFVPDSQRFERTGENEYTIRSEIGWDYFCDLLADNDKGIFDGKVVKLGKSITVTRMAGSDYHDFTGIFDGGGNTLTFNAAATDNYLAPFRNVLGQSENAHAVIRNLNVVTNITATDYRYMAGLIAVVWGYVDVMNCHVTANITSSTGANNPTDLYPSGLASQVPKNSCLSVSGCTVDGTITTDGKYAAGYIGIVQGSASITNSTSSVTINSSKTGDGTHGGFVAAQESNTLTIENCVFNGSLLGSSTDSCGGFVGWRSDTVNITNCIFAPSASCTIGSNDSYTFSRRSGTVSGSYYTVPFGEAQGDFIGWLTLPEGVTASAAEGDTVSYDDKTWYIGGRTVVLTVTPPEGFALAANGLSVFWTDENSEEHDVMATQGTGDEADKWSFEMPDHDVNVTAAFTLVFGTPDFTLPEGLTTIEANAFEGDTLITVVDASNCKSIGAYAFKGCTGLTQIRLDKDCDIDDTAFSDCGTVYVFARAEGKTKMFCDTHEGIEFVAID